MLLVRKLSLSFLLCFPLLAGLSNASEVLLPQGRTAYRADEAVEVAVVGLAKGEKALIKFVPLTPVSNTILAASRPHAIGFQVIGDGSTLNQTVLPYTLAPSLYQVSLSNSKSILTVTIVDGVASSDMILTTTNLPITNGNAIITGYGGSGIVGPDGLPATDIRGKFGPTAAWSNQEMATNIPMWIYWYWESTNIHKPWGAYRSWSAPEMLEAERMYTFMAAQFYRRYGSSVLSIGGQDEPALNNGPVPGHSDQTSTGWPWWDMKPRYAKYGWKWNDNPAGQSPAQWMTYIRAQTHMLGDPFTMASHDLKSVWPDAVYSQDMYAAWSAGVGVDPWHQRINDQPATHIFADSVYSLFSTASGYAIENCAAPGAKINVLENGVHTTPDTAQYSYYALMNQMLMAGMQRTAWLSTTVDGKVLAAVDDHALRYGPFLMKASDAHQIAVLWSFTELAMRLKEANEAQAKGSPLTIPIALPANPMEPATATQTVSGGLAEKDYAETIAYAHAALMRGGYPADIVHENLLPMGGLSRYKALLILGQTHPLPADVMAAIETFVKHGGRVIVDQDTTVAIPGSVVTMADLDHLGYRKDHLMVAAGDKANQQRVGMKAATYFRTNLFYESFTRAAVEPLTTALRSGNLQPVVVPDSTELLIDKKQIGHGSLYMVLNGHEQLPDVDADKGYDWSLTTCTQLRSTYSLNGIDPKAVVYEISGLDWNKVDNIANDGRPISRVFQPGEMKLYLAVPNAPTGLSTNLKQVGDTLVVTAKLNGLAMPWPLSITLADPAGTKVFTIDRSTDATGRYSSAFPIGMNGQTGSYRVVVECPIGNLSTSGQTQFARIVAPPVAIAGPVRVFDRPAIERFLKSKPSITIAVGDPRYQSAANTLAATLKAAGIHATIAPESAVFRRALYPRVFNPYVDVYSPDPTQPFSLPAGSAHVTVKMLDDGGISVVSDDGRDSSELPKDIPVTVGSTGLTMFGYPLDERFFEPGTVVKADENGNVTVLNGTVKRVNATGDLKAKMQRAWTKLYFAPGSLGPILPMAYRTDSNLIVLGDSQHSQIVRALQASEILLQVADEKYPGPGKALVEFAWSPFAVDKDVIFIGATDPVGINAGMKELNAIVHAAQIMDSAAVYDK